MMIRIGFLLFVLTGIVLVTAGLGGFGGDEARVSAREVKSAGLRWAGGGLADAPRRDGDEWEVDVERSDGSLVEVTIGDLLELRGFDEELGPGGRPASDELAGPARRRATRAAMAAAGSGQVFSVEREAGGAVEVNIRRPNGAVEVQLDSGGRVVEVEPEDPGDE